MKYEILSLYTSIIIVLVIQVRGDGLSYEREGKFLNFNGISNLGKLHFDRVLSQWNRSDSYNEKHTIQEPEESTKVDETAQEEIHTSDAYALLEKFSSAFKKCLFSHKDRIIQDAYGGKNIIFKCFRVELIKELQTIVRDVDSVSLLNGYVELEKNGKSKKKIRKRVDKTEEGKEKVYTQYYQNIFDEMFAKEPGTKKSRAFTNATEDSVFSGYGKYVIREIAENLEREEEQVRSLKDSFMDNDLVSVLGEISRKFALRFNLFPGVSARMRRSQSTGVTFDLELDDLTGFGYDDDDDDDKKTKKVKKGLVKGNKDDDSSSEEDDDEEDDDDDDEEEEEDEAEKIEAAKDDGDDDDDDDEEDSDGKGKGKGKGKQKNKMKKKFKMIKKLIPYLLIPMMIQAVLLPIAFKFLLFFAIKALLAGKIALLLVAINLLKNTNFKTDDDEYAERVGQDHYGYGKGEEYGAWINRRAFDEKEESATEAAGNHPYRGYAPTEK